MNKVLSFLIIAATLCACNGNGVNEPKSIRLTAAQKQMVTVSNDFSFNLLRQVGGQQQDFFISPLSASFALAMLANGAEENTQTQILDMLGFDNTSLADLNEYHQQVLTNLPYLDTYTKVNIANAIFVQEDFPVSSTYQQEMKDLYLAQVQNVNFFEQSSLDMINKWAKDNTNKRITNIISPADVTDEMEMLLANALSFIGKWEKKFKLSDTHKEDFYNANGNVSQVDMMNISEDFIGGKVKNYCMVELPYHGDAFVMDILLPADGASIQDVLDSLDAETWLTSYPTDDDPRGLNMVHSRKVDLKLPKFTYEYSRKLNDDLKALGMKDAFDSGVANFNAMSPEVKLFVSFVNQKTYLSVDESGTEAHAVTTIGLAKNASDYADEMSFFVDQPFIFFIRERLNGIILFAGMRSNM